MPINYSKYPPNWKSKIRPAILERANNCCEGCGVENYKLGYRNLAGAFIEVEGDFDIPFGFKMIKIVLTIAHLDHDPENWEVSFDRLKAFCQKCHVNYDLPQRKIKAYKRKHRNQLLLPFFT